MLFDKEEVKKRAKLALSPEEKARDGDLELALLTAIDDMALRIRSAGYMKLHSQTLAANTREVTLSGSDEDLKNIYVIKIGNSTDEYIVDQKDPKYFLSNLDDPDADIGIPKFWAQLQVVNGFPKIKFNCPTDSSYTLKTYYFTDMSPDNLTLARSISALVDGTLAYFYGKASQRGAIYYQNFEGLCAMSRAADAFASETVKTFMLTDEDKSVKKTINNIHNMRL